MTTSLDSILSPGGEATPQADETTKTAEAQPSDAGGKDKEPPAEVGQTDEPSEGNADGKQTTVPHAALHAERQKVKRYTEEVVDLRKSNEALQRQINEVLQRIPVPQQAPVEKPDFFVDPDAAVQNALRPVLQHIGAMSEAMSKRFAVQEHGKEAVDAAFVALEQRIHADPSARAEHQRIMQSGDPWGELVKGHQQLERMAPDYEQRIRADERAKALAEHQPGNGAAPAQQPLVLPSNLATARSVGGRAPPAWAGPTPLADIFNRTKPAA